MNQTLHTNYIWTEVLCYSIFNGKTFHLQLYINTQILIS